MVDAPLEQRRWRVGRRNPRAIYALVSLRPSDADVFIGALDTAAIATEAVAAHNERLVRLYDPPDPLWDAGAP